MWQIVVLYPKCQSAHIHLHFKQETVELEAHTSLYLFLYTFNKMINAF